MFSFLILKSYSLRVTDHHQISEPKHIHFFGGKVFFLLPSTNEFLLCYIIYVYIYIYIYTHTHTYTNLPDLPVNAIARR